MKYFKAIEDGIVISINTIEIDDPAYIEGEITEEEYNEILTAIQNRPTDTEAGFSYRLLEDLTWELYEIPNYQPPVEPSDDDPISSIEFFNMVEEVM